MIDCKMTISDFWIGDDPNICFQNIGICSCEELICQKKILKNTNELYHGYQKLSYHCASLVENPEFH